MRPKLEQKFKKKYFLGLIVFGVLIIVFQVSFYFYKKYTNSKVTEIHFITDDPEKQPILLVDFDPNALDKKQWENLGFSPKQVTTILKYKQVVGGQFISKEQLKKCYAISPSKYSEIEPYILLPESGSDLNSNTFQYEKFQKKTLSIPDKFNPDILSANDWQKMGFSEGQTNAILKYKNFLGGSFVSKEKFKECFIISEENYQKLAPFLLLPDKTPDNYRNYAFTSKAEKPAVHYQPFDPNSLDVQGWKSLGFSEKQAQVIVNYRDRNLRGSFKNLEDVQKCFVISPEKFEEMKPFIRLNPENFKVAAIANTSSPKEKTELSPIPEAKTDFSKIDLNQISFKHLREFGFDEKSSAMILGFRKKLGGFVNKQQVLETYDIDQELAQKLVTTAQINTATVQKYALLDAPDSWLQNHPYFKYSADKIIFYRISNPDEKKIWKYLKLKPEYEAKMRLYLK